MATEYSKEIHITIIARWLIVACLDALGFFLCFKYELYIRGKNEREIPSSSNKTLQEYISDAPTQTQNQPKIEKKKSHTYT